MTKLKIKATLTEMMLGTASNNPDVHDEYIASLAPDAVSRAEEVAAIGVDNEIDKSMTVFPRLNGQSDGQPFVFDYMIRGFLKNAARANARMSDSLTSKQKAYIKIISDTVFVFPRMIPLQYEGAEQGIVGNLQRPLRGQTAQGERISLANSETVPAGAELEFEIEILDSKYVPLVIEWLNYGKYQGLGQWRNASFGRFTYEVVE